MDYVSLPVVNVDLRGAVMPGSYTVAPDGPHMARYLGATVQPTKNGDQFKLHFELVGVPGAVRHKLLDLNALIQAAQGVAVDPTVLKRAKSDMLALLVSGGYAQNQVAAALGNLNLNDVLRAMQFHVWHTEGDYNAQTNPTGRWAEIQFLPPDVWAERQRALANQTTATAQSTVVQTAGPATTAAATPPPSINAGALAAAIQQGAPGGGPLGGALPGFAGAGASGANGLPAFGAPGGGGIGSFLATPGGRT